MDNQKYNGWNNWATWNMSLWLDNEEDSYRYWQGKARFAAIQPKGQESEAVTELAEMLEAECQATPDMDSKDLVDVNWQEIAENMLAE